MAIVKPAEFEQCSTCGTRKLIRDEVLMCDTCARDLAEIETYYDVTVFYHRTGTDTETERFNFDTLKCALVWLSRFKPSADFYFMNLPMLHTPADIKAFAKASR